MQASGIIANGGARISNAGTITGQVTGITSANGGAIVTNSGTITGLAAPGLVFQGNFNSLTNTGTINGNGPLVLGRPTAVQFGSGNDTLTMQAGIVNGHVEQGLGEDTLTMTGGTIGSIDQGGDLDTAIISGGRIIGAFTSGDFVTMTGGQIGSVELRNGNNVMRMSGGTVDGDVSAEQGNDLFELSGGSIGGKLDLGSGNNTINLTGGAIGNGIVTLTGTDRLAWSDAGTIAGAINLGDGNDIATLRNLTSAIMAPTTLLSGGAGNDILTFDNVETSGVSRFQNWETLALTNGSRLTLDGNLQMGDAGTQTGTVSIDATSILFAGGGTNPSILPFTAGQLVTVINAGVIDLTNGPISANERLTIAGNYVGTNGRLLLHTFLGDDNSPSDRLIISGGSATGRTVVGITNVGGPGALTRSDGILVVQAVNATTAPTAFVQSGRIVAGAYEYFLFRGATSPGSQESWFLRSTLIPGSQPAAQQPPQPAAQQPPLAAQPAPPPITAPSSPSPDGPAIPLFRPEVPVYAAVPGTTRLLLLSILSTFHERRGEQSLLQGKGIVPAAWGRFLGQRVERQWAGTATPEFDGSILGLEVGVDLASFEIASGHVDRLGLFFAYAQASGDVSGFAIGEQQEVGHERINSYGLGGYWTHIGPTGWYVDTVLTGLWFDGDANSNFGTGIDVSGNSIAASIEAGYPIPLTRQISLEPQAQFIWQHFWLDDERDAFSTVGFNTPEGFTGRVGLRLRGSFTAETILWQPYLKVNLWQSFGGDDEVLFGGSDAISSEQRTTALEAGGGIAIKIHEAVGLYATLSWTNDLDGNTVHSLAGNFGLRVAW